MHRQIGLFLAILLPFIVLAVEQTWKLTKDKNQITTYIGPPNDTGLRSTRSIMTVPQSPEQALVAIVDFNTYTSWVPYCEESKTVENQGDTLYHFFQLLDMPLVKNRDMFIKVTVDEIKGGYQVKMNAAPNYTDEDPDAVRITVLNANYRIYKDAITGSTLVEMENEVDPGGYIPTFALNWASRSQPFETFTSLRSHMSGYASNENSLNN